MRKIRFISEYTVDGTLIFFISIISFCFFCKNYLGLLLFIIPSIFLIGNCVSVKGDLMISYRFFKKHSHSVKDIKCIRLSEKEYKIVLIDFVSKKNDERKDTITIDYFLQSRKLIVFLEEISKQKLECNFSIEDTRVTVEDFQYFVENLQEKVLHYQKHLMQH